MTQYHNRQIRHLGAVLLEIGALLMTAGANTARIRITVERIARAFGCSAEVFITHRALTLNDSQHEDIFSSSKRTPPHGVDFKVVSGISRMSWHVAEENWSIAAIRKELVRLAALPRYPRIVVLLMVGLAGASFCRLFGGDPVEMGIAFVATFFGLAVRQETHQRGFNPYLCVYVAALVAALIAGGVTRFNGRVTLEHAFATSVLFLVPGVPLINSFSDMVDGNFLTGLSRFAHGFVISLCIALGLLTALHVYGLQP
ncbi:MAG: threonine/serine exporter family protein [Propionivibrio sp.]